MSQKEINILENTIETTDYLISDVFDSIEDDDSDSNDSSLPLPPLDESSRLRLKRLIEALLFATNEPLTLQKIREVTDTLHPSKPRVLRMLIQELQHDYITQGRAFRLEEIAQGYALRSCEEFGTFIDLLWRNKRSEKLSPAATEVLAIVAFRQPITRPQIDAIRGVDSSGTIQALLERQLIEIIGRLEAPGRPSLFGTTKNFLTHYGLKDIKDLKSDMPKQ